MRLPSVRLSALCAVLGLLAGCASDPVNYYTLTPAGRPDVPATAPAGGALVEVLPVSVPPQIDLPQLVVRTGTGQVRSLDGDRWVGPLPDEFRGALAHSLSARMGVPAVQGLRPDAATPVWRVQVHIQRFETVSGEAVELDAVWRARLAPGGQATPVCHSQLREPVGPGVPAAVEGHQRNVARLAAEIAAALQAGGGAARCPRQ